MMRAAGLAIVNEDVRTVLAEDLPWERFSGSTVAVTGASGFIGSYLVRVLLAMHAQGKVSQAVKVAAVARDVAKARARFADLGDGVPLEFVACDLAQPEGLALRADWFFHAASHASPKHYGKDPVGTAAPNVVGTSHLLKLAAGSRAAGFLFVSSSEVYGDTRGRSTLDEDSYGLLDPTALRTVYGGSKRMGETLCVAWMQQHGVPVFIVRPFHTYGPGVALDDGRVFADFAADVVAGRDIRMASDGSARRAFCYVSDALRGIFRVVLTGEPGRAYNVANPQGDLSIRELAELMVSTVPHKQLKVVAAQAPPQPGYLKNPNDFVLPSIERIGALGWSPRITPAQGFRRMVESYA